MKRISIACLAAAFSILCVVAAEQTADFSGTWVLDAKKSDPFPRAVLGVGGPGFDMSGGAGGGGMPGMGGTTPSAKDVGGFPPGAMGPAGGMGAPPTAENPPLVIRQSETEMEFSRTMKADSGEIPVIDTYKVDGSENVSMVQVANAPDPVKVTTRATLRKNKFIVSMTSHNPQGKSEVKREYSLSKDGKTLTLNITNSGPRGQFEQKQVYRRQ